MQVITSVHEMQSVAIGQRAHGKLIGLVPTMGALHRGHESLIEVARDRADFSVVSIFVNPTQFGANEDFDQYPRPLEEDLGKCRSLGVDVAFCPSREEMYPPTYSTFVDEEWVSQGLCGISRPNHFRGVVTVCCKLFNIVRPDLAVFGQKDAQQCGVVRKMIDDLHLPVEMVIAPTLREDDGLAMSSRNRYLTKEQRADAVRIFEALTVGKKLIDEGVKSVDRVIAEVLHILSKSRRLRVIYVSAVDRQYFQPVREITPGEGVLAVACWVDEVRLIDNIVY